VIVVLKKYWFFPEIKVTSNDSIDNEYGLAFHRVALGLEDICLGCVGRQAGSLPGSRTGLSFWD
jgi:hypothetical protein